MLLLGPEKFKNPSFEYDPTSAYYWERKSLDGTLLVNSEWPIHLNHHARFTTGGYGTGSFGLKHRWIHLEDRDYMFSGWITAPVSGEWSMELWDYTVGSLVMTVVSGFSPSEVGSPAWYGVTGSFTITIPDSYTFIINVPEILFTNFDLDNLSVRQVIDLPVTYDFRDAPLRYYEEARPVRGILNHWVGSNWRRFELPVTWLSAQYRDDLISWYRASEVLRFCELDDPRSYHEVKIVDCKIRQYEYPESSSYYRGRIVLETTGDVFW